MKELKKVVSQRIKNLRELRNLTQEELAERAGLSYKYIGEIERGSGNPTIEILGKLAKALETPLTQLITEKEEDEILSELSKQDIQAIRKALEILGRVFGEK